MRKVTFAIALLVVAFIPVSAKAQFVYSFDSGAVSVSATPNGTSHAAGNSIGGLFSVPIARVVGGSGVINQILWKSNGGSTGVLVFRIWQKNPTNTTCADQTAFVGSDTDDQNLIVAPFTITPAAPGNTTGDSATYGSSNGLTYNFKNADAVPTRNVYVCAITETTDTVDENMVVRLTLGAKQD
jgi:hypothetical protein